MPLSLVTLMYLGNVHAMDKVWCQQGGSMFQTATQRNSLIHGKKRETESQGIFRAMTSQGYFCSLTELIEKTNKTSFVTEKFQNVIGQKVRAVNLYYLLN